MPFPYTTVLVTGASSGIGLALTERLIANDVFVVAAARRKDRLEALLAKHGPSKLAIEVIDLADLAALPAWAEHLTSTYPSLSALILNAGHQRSLSCLSPSPPSLDALAATTAEMTLNYLSPLHCSLLLTPHLRAQAAKGTPTALILVSSALALVPIPRVPNYCASKAALHSLAWQLRTQLADDHAPVKVIEIIPPAVQTELHTVQGLPAMGMPLQDFIDEVWSKLEAGQEEEIPVGPAKGFAHVEDERRKAYKGLVQAMKAAGESA